MSFKQKINLLFVLLCVGTGCASGSHVSGGNGEGPAVSGLESITGEFAFASSENYLNLISTGVLPISAPSEGDEFIMGDPALELGMRLIEE